MEWNTEATTKTEEQVIQELGEGDPRIVVRRADKGINITPNTMQPGEELIVAERVAQVLGARERVTGPPRG